MDKRRCSSVRRCDFFEACTKHVTLDMRRTITRGDIHERFRSSAAEMTLSELLKRIWPTATAVDHKTMSNWAKLHDVSSLFSAASFQGARQDLEQVFDLLDVDGSQTLSIGELVRARMLTQDESEKLLQDWYKAFKNTQQKQDSDDDSKRESVMNARLDLSFNEFCVMTQAHLAEKFGQ